MTQNADIAIQVNGTPRRIAATASLRELLASMDLLENGQARRGVAIAVNDEVVPRARHAEVRLQNNDRIEIIHPVGGG